MNLHLLKTSRPSSVDRSHWFIHAEYPLEQTLRSDEPAVREKLKCEAWRRSRSVDTLHLADYKGLRLLGKSEAALDAAARPLQRRFGSKIVVDAPSVRYVFGSPTLEPYMKVLLNAPVQHGEAVKSDFLERGGQIKRLHQRSCFILEGEAPLARLLGYRQWLRNLVLTDPCLGMWLSRYLPMDDDGGPYGA